MSSSITPLSEGTLDARLADVRQFNARHGFSDLPLQFWPGLPAGGAAGLA